MFYSLDGQAVLFDAPQIPAGMTGIHWNPPEWDRNPPEQDWNPLESTGMGQEWAGMDLKSTGMGYLNKTAIFGSQYYIFIKLFIYYTFNYTYIYYFTYVIKIIEKNK